MSTTYGNHKLTGNISFIKDGVISTIQSNIQLSDIVVTMPNIDGTLLTDTTLGSTNRLYAPATDSGVNEYVADLSSYVQVLSVGQVYWIRFTSSNTGQATLDINTAAGPTGPVPIRKSNGTTEIDAGDLISNGVYAILYTGTVYQVLNNVVTLKNIATNDLVFFANSTTDLAGYRAIFDNAELKINAATNIDPSQEIPLEVNDQYGNPMLRMYGNVNHLLNGSILFDSGYDASNNPVFNNYHTLRGQQVFFEIRTGQYGATPINYAPTTGSVFQAFGDIFGNFYLRNIANANANLQLSAGSIILVDATPLMIKSEGDTSGNTAMQVTKNDGSTNIFKIFGHGYHLMEQNRTDSLISWQPTLQISKTNTGDAFTRALNVTLTGAGNGYAMGVSNATSGNTVDIATPSNAIETVGHIYLGGVNKNLTVVQGHVRSNSNTNDSSSYAALFYNLNSDPLFFVRSDGKTGAGTSDPATRLHVSSQQSVTTSKWSGTYGFLPYTPLLVTGNSSAGAHMIVANEDNTGISQVVIGPNSGNEALFIGVYGSGASGALGQNVNLTNSSAVRLQFQSSKIYLTSSIGGSKEIYNVNEVGSGYLSQRIGGFGILQDQNSSIHNQPEAAFTAKLRNDPNGGYASRGIWIENLATIPGTTTQNLSSIINNPNITTGTLGGNMLLIDDQVDSDMNLLYLKKQGVDVLKVYSNNRIVPNLPNYADDAAADADSTLPSGALYQTTAGGRAVFRKP